MHEVIITEKPTSAEKIAKALSSSAVKNKYGKKVNYWSIKEKDKEITVLSAVGHIYSLVPNNPKDKIYFDLHWDPAYKTSKNLNYTKDYVLAIKKLAKGADSYIHACDYDVEGSLIGYNALKFACGDDSLNNASRMKFSTLTKKDILEAYENRIKIDFNQVNSGIARHILDFYFGVNISRFLMKSVRSATYKFLKLSAGRVQTPTLSILTEREKEIKKFIPEPYWLIKALINPDIIAEHKGGRIFDKDKASNIFEKCKGKDALVNKLRITKSKTKPPVPFNLGGLQSESYAVFGYSPKRTQAIAQNLYTGGYTSYPRTSSQKLPKSLDFKNIFKDLSKNSEFKKHIDVLSNKSKPNEGKKDDAAHPAIHPTGILPKKLSKDELNVYKLIVYRFISVFSEDAEFESMRADLKIADEEFFFKRRRVSYMGWLNHYPFKKPDNDEFPNVKKGDTLPVKKITSEEKETKPPARYNEVSLIKELEKRELGTKATRADIIAKLYDREYISGKKIEVSQLGENVIDTLTEYCKDLTSEELTRNFERQLEAIQNDKITKENLIEDAKVEVSSILKDIEKNQKEIGLKLYEAYERTKIVDDCVCGGELVVRYSPKTKSNFVGCTNYPDCKIAYSLPKGFNILKTKCEKCGLPLISFGKPRKRACLDPNCGKDVADRKSPEVVGECPKCGNDLLERSGRYGKFIGCSNFPSCRFTCSIDELDSILNKKEEKK